VTKIEYGFGSSSVFFRGWILVKARRASPTANTAHTE